MKWKYTVFGKEYEVINEKYTGGNPSRMVVVIGFMSGAAFTAAVCILTFFDAPIKYFQSFVVSPAGGGGNNKKNKIK